MSDSTKQRRCESCKRFMSDEDYGWAEDVELCQRCAAELADEPAAPAPGEAQRPGDGGER